MQFHRDQTDLLNKLSGNLYNVYKTQMTFGLTDPPENKGAHTMKKTIFLALCLMLAAALAFSAANGMAEEEAPAETLRITNIQKAVAEGGSKALWELVNTHYATNQYLEEGHAMLYIWAPNGPAFPVQKSIDFQLMNFQTVAIRETAGVGFSLEQIITYEVQPDGTCKENNATQDLFPDGPAHIGPFGNFAFYSNYASVSCSQICVIVAAGTDDNGHELEFYGVVQRPNALQATIPALVTGNPDYDTDNLRYDADYKVKVADGVWWVPVNELGKTRYTNREIAAMTEHSPEEKQEEISTLYEAVQLFQISNFTYSEDNVRITEGELSWEHHKPGRDAVRTNTGCCASCSSWLNYLLSGDYEQMGYLAYNFPDGLGHVFNYIFRDGWYYFIDLTCYTAEDMAKAPESGYTSDYNPARVIHKVREPEDYVKYFLQSRTENPAVFFLYQSEIVSPISGRESSEGEKGSIILPEEYDFKFMDGREADKIKVELVPGPEKTYRWAGQKSAKIKVKKQYLRTPEEPSEPLTAYRPGDQLTLEDKSERGLAVIDGIKYSTSKREEVCLEFENNLLLDGEYINGVFNLTLPLGLHGEALKDMDSLILGELTLGIVKAIPKVQVVICVREGDVLTVQEVLEEDYYDSRRISIRKDENGNWQDSSDYWYLIITKDNKTKYEFGRFFCSVSDES